MFVHLRWCEHAPGPPCPGASPCGPRRGRARTPIPLLLLVLLAAGGIAAPAAIPAPGTAPTPGAPGTDAGTCAAETSLPPVPLSYRIELTLDPGTGEFHGRETIRWRRPGREPIETIPLHLYLNAFSHRDTTWMRESGEFGRGLPGKIRPGEWGYIRLDRVVRLPSWGGLEACDPGELPLPGPAESPAETPLGYRFIRPDDGNPLDATLAEVLLDRPLLEGETLLLGIEFSGKFPRIIARTGCTGGFCLGGQWFPKPGVYELPGTRGATRERWVAHQFHGPTEFYAEYGDFDVTLDVPEGVTVGATGVEVPPGRRPDPGRALHRFVQRAVHDFAFTAARGLARLTEEHVPPGRACPVRLVAIYPPGNEGQARRALAAAAGAMDILGRAVGPYPYGTLTVVLPPWRGRFAVGMEYPTFITGLVADPLLERGPLASIRMPEITVLHEFAHQYFYGMVGSCEQEDAFLDEGFTNYWETRATRDLYGEHGSGGTLFGRPLDMVGSCRLRLLSALDEIRDPVLHRPSWLYWPGTGSAEIYCRTRLLLEQVERTFGRKTLDAIFREYFRRWRFRHPGPADFLAVAREVGGDDVAALVREEWTSPRPADYAVDTVEVERWQPPAGRVFLPIGGPECRDDQPVTLDGDRRELERLAEAPAVANRWLEQDGRLHVRITDPGTSLPDGTILPGGRRWVAVPLPGNHHGDRKGPAAREEEGAGSNGSATGGRPGPGSPAGKEQKSTGKGAANASPGQGSPDSDAGGPGIPAGSEEKSAGKGGANASPGPGTPLGGPDGSVAKGAGESPGKSAMNTRPGPGTPPGDREDGAAATLPWRNVVRITGPGRAHLPVKVRLVFEDGAVFEETWDGRSPWREYLAIRPARLERVVVDPDGQTVLEAGPAGNGRLREAPRQPVRDWSAWFAGLAAWLAAGVSSWL